MEDLNTLRITARKLTRDIPFRKPYHFRIEITNQPIDFSFYVSDISYGPVEITTETIKAGAMILTFPVSSEPVSITMTVRDHEDRRIYKWASAMAAKIINPDGTVNLPSEYLVKMTRYSLVSDGKSEEETDKWDAFITKCGDIRESVEDGDKFLDFPINFISFKSL